jgi:hypothetical protein
MDIYDYIEQMIPHINAKDWDALESHFKSIAEFLAGKEYTSKIAEVNLSNYQNSLCTELSLAIEKARNLSAKAIYFEYDLDNDWQSNFFICQDYNPQMSGDEDWACDWLDEVKGSDFSLFGDLYIPGFDSTEAFRGANLYLIARTVAAFGRSCEKYQSEKFAICLAFHDQDPVMRIYEPTA